jgi:hypothetical protein
MQMSGVMLLFIGIAISGVRFACFYREGNHKTITQAFPAYRLVEQLLCLSTRRVSLRSLSLGTTHYARLYGGGQTSELTRLCGDSRGSLPLYLVFILDEQALMTCINGRIPSCQTIPQSQRTSLDAMHR